MLNKDFASLANDSWLSDTIIEAYFTCFCKKYNVFVMSSNMATMICKYGKTATVVRRNFLSYDFMAGPVHLNENHWALLIASIKTKEVI